MRTIEDHKVNPANDKVNITVLDEAGSGGANHQYAVTWTDKEGTLQQRVIDFQNGPIPEFGVNGFTQEVLLAIVADRLRCFQAGPFATKANACALTHIEEAMHWLHQRTLERMRRGVEGTHTV